MSTQPTYPAYRARMKVRWHNEDSWHEIEYFEGEVIANGYSVGEAIKALSLKLELDYPGHEQVDAGVVEKVNPVNLENSEFTYTPVMYILKSTNSKKLEEL